MFEVETPVKIFSLSSGDQLRCSHHLVHHTSIPAMCVQEGRTSAAVGLLGVSSTDPSGKAAIHGAKLGG